MTSFFKKKNAPMIGRETTVATFSKWRITPKFHKADYISRFQTTRSPEFHGMR
jgi:hypothetical protein